MNATQQDAVIRFEAGRSYVHGYITDADAKTVHRVVRRSQSTIWIAQQQANGSLLEPVARRVKVYDGCEYVMPFGTYSMAPSLRATEQL